MTLPLPEPSDAVTGTKERFLAYLDFYRSQIARKLDGLSDEDLRKSRLPSGWSPLELLKHLVFMERRWLVWRFGGEALPDPAGEDGPDGRWHVDSADTLDGLVAQLHEGGLRTRAIVEAADLTDRRSAGATADVEPRSLEWVLFHVLQEYARHAGHLDIARELIDGLTGED
jgi:uncharacterized damage-inducible protein DinB